MRAEVESSPSTDAAVAHLDPGRRDRKKLATRRAIRLAALDLVATRGFAHVTVEDIAGAADVATRTFFNYFPSKESAVIGSDPEQTGRMCADLLARPIDECPIDALRAVLLEYAASIAESIDELGESRAAWFRRFSIVREDRELLGAYARHVAEVERRLVSALSTRLGVDPELDAYPALLTATVLAATRVAALHWSANGGNESLAELTALAIDALRGGLGNLKPFPIDDRRHERARVADQAEGVR